MSRGVIIFISLAILATAGVVFLIQPTAALAILGAGVLLVGGPLLIARVVRQRTSVAGRERARRLAARIGGGVSALLLLGFAGALLVRHLQHQRAVAPFADHVGALARLQPGPLPPLPDSPFDVAEAHGRLGRVLPIDKQAVAVDELYFELGAEQRPRQLAEIDTVAWLFWSERRVGRYSDDKPMLVRVCRVVLLDRRTSRFLAQGRFQGGWPPQVRKESASNYGPRPDDQIVRWLASAGGPPPKRPQ